MPRCRSAFGAIDPRKVNKPASRPLREGRASRRAATSSSCAPPTPASYDARPGAHRRRRFEAGQLVDVTGTTKGKGFAGVMKRHGFKGSPPATVSQRNHRTPGSIGACADPGPRLQGHADGRSHGRRARHRAEPHGPRGRRREGPAARQGRRSRPQGRASSSSATQRRRRRPMATVTTPSTSRRQAARRPARSSCPPTSSTCRPTSR